MHRVRGKQAWRTVPAAVVGAVVILLFALPGTASARSAAATPTGASPGTATVPLLGSEAAQPAVTVPAVPSVATSITEGQPAGTLLSHAISLLLAGDRASGLQTALSAAQAKVDADQVTATSSARAAAVSEAAAARATATATAAAQAATASADRSAHDHADARQLRAATASLSGALHRAALDLYMNGGTPLPSLPTRSGQLEGDAVIDAMVGEQVALSPQGILAAERRAAGQAHATAGVAAADVGATEAASLAASSAAKAARTASATARTASATAARALAASNAEVASLRHQLGSVDGADATLLQGEATALATQAGRELTSGVSLQFTPADPLPAPMPTTAVALAWAFSQLGKPYLWGGTGPDSFDCSGLTQSSWGHAGVAIPRVAAAQYSWIVPVPLSDLRPGDLVFFGTDVHHVGMYIGDGLMINSPHTGSVVSITDIWWSDLIGFGRVHGASTPVPAHTPPQTTGAVESGAGTVPSQTSPTGITGSGTSSTTAPSSSSSPSSSSPSSSSSSSSSTGSSSTIG